MRKIERIIHKWLKILELENYTVHCFIRNPNEIKGFRKDDTAMIDIALGEKRLEIYLNPEAKKKWDEKLLLHELTHVFLYRLWEFVDHVIQKGYRGQKTQEVLKAAYENLEEETVDRLVSILLKLKNPRRKNARSKNRVILSQAK